MESGYTVVALGLSQGSLFAPHACTTISIHSAQKMLLRESRLVPTKEETIDWLVDGVDIYKHKCTNKSELELLNVVTERDKTMLNKIRLVYERLGVMTIYESDITEEEADEFKLITLPQAIRTMREKAIKYGRVSAVFTRRIYSISICMIKNGPVYLFDSHLRNTLTGLPIKEFEEEASAILLEFTGDGALMQYLQQAYKMMPVSNEKNFIEVNQFEFHVYTKKANKQSQENKENPDSSTQTEQEGEIDQENPEETTRTKRMRRQ